jgi:hypothetical protein
MKHTVIFLLLLASCAAPDKLNNLDLIKWRNDRGSCKNERPALVAAFKEVEPQLLGMHIDNVTKALGRPDIQQLAARDQKYYVYFLEKGVHCNDITQKSSAQKVLLRFNAVGLLAEVIYQTEPL